MWIPKPSRHLRHGKKNIGKPAINCRVALYSSAKPEYLMILIDLFSGNPGRLTGSDHLLKGTK
jgi:hypothetical protein